MNKHVRAAPVGTLALVVLVSAAFVAGRTPALRVWDPSILGLLAWPLGHFSAAHLAVNAVVILAAGAVVERAGGRRALALAVGVVVGVSAVGAAGVVALTDAHALVAGASALAAGLVVVGVALARPLGLSTVECVAAATVAVGGVLGVPLLTLGLAAGGGVASAVHLAGVVGGVVAVVVVSQSRMMPAS